MASLEGHYSELLGLDANWKVTSVDLSLQDQRVEIGVTWDGGRETACPECGERCRLYDLRAERRWRHLDTMQFETVISCRVPRCECPQHGVVTVAVPWAGKHSRFTLMFEAFAIRVLQACSNVEAARRLLGLSWRQVDEIRRRAVERGLARREEEPVERIGLDEKSFGRGHDYISVMSDLDGSRVLEVVAERKQTAAEALLSTLSLQQREAVLAVALDMWPAYMNAAQALLPEAVLVHDKFHVVKHLSEAVDNVRKAENKSLLKEGDSQLKDAKYLFLKKPERMSQTQRDRFEELRASNLKSARAWAIKEQFGEFWSFEFVADAREFFADWHGWAVRSRLKPMAQKAKMLKKHLGGLLGYVLHPVTNAATEGLNSKIQYLKASARGFRSFQRYRDAILFYCGKLDMMPVMPASPQKT